ncbi:MAG: hypothetical protein WCK08_02120 [Betaproteobacteria bacterium]
MTGQERDELMRFLRDLSTSREPVDAGATNLIAQAVAQNPNVGYRLVQQIMALRMALGAQAPTASSPAPAQADSPSIWGSGLLKTALAAGLGAAAGTVLADQASSWLGGDDFDLGD